MQLLLMAEEEIPAHKAAGAIGAFERLLLRMRALMALEVLQSGEGAVASGADMGPRLVCLGTRDVSIGAGLAIGLGLLLILLRGSRHVCGNYVHTGEIHHIRA